eukprot:scaffold29703_cov68-Phaeocystis_antarctica.AAC.2
MVGYHATVHDSARCSVPHSPTVYLSIYLSASSIASAFSSGRPARDAHYFFPSRSPDPQPTPEELFQPPHTSLEACCVAVSSRQDETAGEGGGYIGRGGAPRRGGLAVHCLDEEHEPVLPPP